jgi:hypothetical protein
MYRLGDGEFIAGNLLELRYGFITTFSADGDSFLDENRQIDLFYSRYPSLLKLPNFAPGGYYV